MFDNSSVDVMEVLRSCRCCLLRPPVKDLKTPYEHHDKTEIYSDMIKDCFDLDIYLVNEECGICELCVGRLRDARDFKLQVQRSQEELQARDRARHVSDGEICLKSEMVDDSDGEMMEEEFSMTLYEGTSVKSETSEFIVKIEEEDISPYEQTVKFEMNEDNIASVTTHMTRAQADGAEGQTYTGQKRHSSKSNLRKKLRKRSHKGDRPYACDTCSKRFRRKDNLAAHVITHTGQKPFRCEQCNQRFNSSRSLLRHKGVHSEDKPHTCDICGERFKKKTDLKSHIRLCSGKIFFSCEQCNRHFASKHSLKRHKQTHTGDRPYSCDICSKRFTQKGHMTVHRKSHKGKAGLTIHKNTYGNNC